MIVIKATLDETRLHIVICLFHLQVTTHSHTYVLYIQTCNETSHFKMHLKGFIKNHSSFFYLIMMTIYNENPNLISIY